MIPHGPPGQMLALASPATAKQPQSLSDIDIATLPPELKKEGQDWFCIFNPALFGPGRERERKKPEVNLVYNFTHATVVCCVQFSTDGKYLATGCNRTAQIFDMANGHKVCALADDTVSQVGDLYIRSVRFSPDGKYLATGAEDKLVRVRRTPFFFSFIYLFMFYTDLGHQSPPYHRHLSRPHPRNLLTGFLSRWSIHRLWLRGPHDAHMGPWRIPQIAKPIILC